MNGSACPASDELRAFIRAELCEDAADRIASHLDTCHNCRETVDTEWHNSACPIGDAVPPDFQAVVHEADFKRAFDEIAGLRHGPPVQPDDSPTRPAPALCPGSMLGEYEILEPLGRGGMGSVYKARHTRLKRLVAVKVLLPEKINDAESFSRFQREMTIVGQLAHPHLVAAYDAR